MDYTKTCFMYNEDLVSEMAITVSWGLQKLKYTILKMEIIKRPMWPLCTKILAKVYIVKRNSSREHEH